MLGVIFVIWYIRYLIWYVRCKMSNIIC